MIVNKRLILDSSLWLVLTTIYVTSTATFADVLPSSKLVVMKRSRDTATRLHSLQRFTANSTNRQPACFRSKCILLVNENEIPLLNSTMGEDSISSISNQAVFQLFHSSTPVMNSYTTMGTECVEQNITQTPNLWYLKRINVRTKSKETDYFSYSLENDGQGVTVYVLDSGINVEHLQFENRARNGFVADGVDNGSFADLAGHGTQVAGNIGSNLYGVAKSVQLVSVKVMNRFGSGTEMDIVDGLEWVYDTIINSTEYIVYDTAYKVLINLSLGTYSDAPGIQAAVRELIDIGALVVTAAGNDDEGACTVTPGKMPEVLNVGSTNEQDELVEDYNWGSCIDILAPGTNIPSTGHLNNTHETVYSGTSFSAPLVTGVAARILSAYPCPIPPAILKNITVGVATEDVVTISQIHKESTPNLLLFVNCTGNPELPTTVPCLDITPDNSTGSATDVENGTRSSLAINVHLWIMSLATVTLFNMFVSLR